MKLLCWQGTFCAVKMLGCNFSIGLTGKTCFVYIILSVQCNQKGTFLSFSFTMESMLICLLRCTLKIFYRNYFELNYDEEKN